jgi:hypothetical protein
MEDIGTSSWRLSGETTPVAGVDGRGHEIPLHRRRWVGTSSIAEERCYARRASFRQTSDEPSVRMSFGVLCIVLFAMFAIVRFPPGSASWMTPVENFAPCGSKSYFLF